VVVATDDDDPVVRDAHLVRGCATVRLVLLINDEEVRLAVLEQIDELRNGEVPVEWHALASAEDIAEGYLWPLQAVAREDGPSIAGVQSRRAKSIRNLCGPRLDLSPRELTLVGDDRNFVRMRVRAR